MSNQSIIGDYRIISGLDTEGLPEYTLQQLRENQVKIVNLEKRENDSRAAGWVTIQSYPSMDFAQQAWRALISPVINLSELQRIEDARHAQAVGQGTTVTRAG